MIGEQMGFARELLSGEREYLERHLAAKWLAGDRCVVTNFYDMIHVANDAVLQLRNESEDDSAIVVGTIEGGGTVRAESISASLLNVRPNDLSGFDTLSVQGAFSFLPDARLRIDCTGYNRLVPGDYTVLLAGSIRGSCKLELLGVPRSRLLKMKITDSGVVVSVCKQEMAIILR